jgi:hypothetical protein
MSHREIQREPALLFFKRPQVGFDNLPCRQEKCVQLGLDMRLPVLAQSFLSGVLAGFGKKPLLDSPAILLERTGNLTHQASQQRRNLAQA